MKISVMLARVVLFFALGTVVGTVPGTVFGTGLATASAQQKSAHRAANSATKARKAALEVVVLGSGGPRTFGRAGSSYLVMLDGTPRILVDAGPGAFVRIGELQLDLDAVDTVLLTHLHIDHSGDLAAFFNARALTSDGPVNYRIFGPGGTGLFPSTSRFVDLLVGDEGAFAYQKT